MKNDETQTAKDCVDLKNNTCFFGYGGVQVSVIFFTIRFKGVKPPIGAGNPLWDKEDGAKIGEWEWTGSELSVRFVSLDELKVFANQLKEIEKKQTGSFEFKGVTVDFTHYAQESMDIVSDAVEYVRMNMLQAVAC